jgi:hypothetical protein
MSKKETCGDEAHSLPEVEAAAVSDGTSGGIMRRYQLGKIWI